MVTFCLKSRRSYKDSAPKLTSGEKIKFENIYILFKTDVSHKAVIP